MSTLVLDKVSKTFGGLAAVADLTMSAPAGKITGLIGPNGAGKTTVVNLITGVFSLTTGSVRYGDKDLSFMPRFDVARAGISRTFQTIRLLADATVIENIIMGMYVHQKASLAAQLFALSASRRETERFREEAYALLDQFRMRRYADYPAGGLSYGDQRRVEMMRALAAKPSMILLDEPVAGMNDVEAEALGEIFRDLAKKGMGVLLIEHNLGFVTSMCDHIYVLNGGRLISEGTSDQVMNDPAVVTAYIGEDEDA